MSIIDLEGKYHIKLDTNGFIIPHAANGRFLYEKKPAPSFVNKTSSGDSSYRDASFWQFWAQINWRNGSKQERFDDGGKFWKSSNIDITQMEKVKLSPPLVSAGQVVAGEEARASLSWRGAQAWWNGNYTYRQQLTITAPAGITIPANFPIKVEIDTAALQTAGKVRSDRKDWRIVFWNGTTWVELYRHYVDTTATYFPLQAELAGGSSNNNYYVFYGYASESTDKTPTTEADWNSIYYPKDDDAYVLGLWHLREGTGDSAEDSSGNNLDMSKQSGTSSWHTDGRYGNAYHGGVLRTGTSAAMNIGSFTVDFVYKADSISPSTSDELFELRVPGGEDKFGIRRSEDDIKVYTQTAGGTPEVTFTAAIPDTTTYHRYSITHDGSVTGKLYIDGVLYQTKTFAAAGVRSTLDPAFNIGIGSTAPKGYLQHIRFDSVARTSFTGGITTDPTCSAGGGGNHSTSRIFIYRICGFL